MVPWLATGEGAMGGVKAGDVVGAGKVRTVGGTMGAFGATESGRVGEVVGAVDTVGSTVGSVETVKFVGEAMLVGVRVIGVAGDAGAMGAVGVVRMIDGATGVVRVVRFSEVVGAMG
jgi:hypothetical protein